MNKRVGVIALLVGCLTFVAYVYLKPNSSASVAQEVYEKSVVFKDKDDELIPISVNLYSQVDMEEEIRNRLDIMKNDTLHEYGLYPIISQGLELLSMELKNGVLTLNFNDQLYANGDALDVIEALTYTMTDYDDVKRLKIQINDKDVSYIPNSTIPLSFLTKDLGLNNFVETSSILHETIPVMVYNEKNINDYSYLVPTTIRIDENDSLKSQVSTILSYVQSQIHVLDAHLDNRVLTVELDSNILLDNEHLDQTLENLILLSLSSLKDVEDVKIVINGEDVQTKSASSIEYNQMKI